MKRNGFTLFILISALLTIVACKEEKKDESRNNKTVAEKSENAFIPKNALVKRTLQNENGQTVSYTNLVYNKEGKVDSINKYNNNNVLDEFLAFKYNGDGNVEKLEQSIGGGEVTQIKFIYTNGLIVGAEKTEGQTRTGNYVLTYDGGKLVKIDIMNNISGSDMSNIILYMNDGKVAAQSNPFFTGGGPSGNTFSLGHNKEDSIKYLEYYPQVIKPIVPPLDNLVVKYYVKKAQVGSTIYFYETIFDNLGNPIKTIKRLDA